MACVTLKRSLDLEPLYSPNGSVAKRRRCTPLTPLFARNEQSVVDSSTNWQQRSKSNSSEMKRVFGGENSSMSTQNVPGTFSSLPMPSNDELYNRIREEWKRLKRRRQLKYAASKDYSNKHFSNHCSKRGVSPGCGSSSGSDNDDGGVNCYPSSSTSSPHHHHHRTRGGDQSVIKEHHRREPLNEEFGGGSGGSAALFTLEQVVTICNKLLVDRDNTLREEYDKALSEKLAEQYDAFVKFTHDQIQSRLSHSASYVS